VVTKTNHALNHVGADYLALDLK